MDEFIEIPFGANDSELKGWEYTIPEDMEAVIKDGKIIVRQKKNEDEKIRKLNLWLLRKYKEISHYRGNSEEGIDMVISYLEKQKDSKWSPSEDEMGVLYKLCYISNQVTDEDDTELTRLYQDLKQEYFNGHSFENMFPSEKQKEQTREYPHSVIENAISFLTERNDGMPKDEARNIVNAVISVIKPEHWPRYRVQQPTEWSEKDEKDIQEAADYLRDYANNCVQGGNSKSYLQSLADRIESLRPQPKQEWSDEDEKNLKDLLAYGEMRLGLRHWIAGLPEKLNSRLQPHWKPTNEQMNAFEESLMSVAYTENKIILESLYEQLKKL